MAYAEGTSVPVERSMSEIVALVKKNGAQRIAQAETEDGFAVQFFLSDRMLRFRVAVPPAPTMAGIRRMNEAEQKKSVERRTMQRARALLLVIKAKLESVESGVETFEEAFLANVVLPDGKTVGELTLPQIAQSYADGRQPPLMLSMGGAHG